VPGSEGLLPPQYTDFKKSAAPPYSNPVEELANIPTLSIEEINTIINDTQDSAGLFELVIKHRNENITINFGIVLLLKKHGLLHADTEIKTIITSRQGSTIPQTFLYAKRDNQIGTYFPATKELVHILTHDIPYDLNMRNEFDIFKKLLNRCCKMEFDTYVYRDQGGRYPKECKLFRQEFLDFVKNSNKHKTVIPEVKKIEGYGLIAMKQPIFLPSNANDQLKRLFILLGSLSAQNNNPNLLKEFTAILDELYKNKTISKMLYEILYYKGKNFLDRNLKKK